MPPHRPRDLADPRLWDVSLARSHSRRHTPKPSRSKLPYAAATALALSAAAGTAAAPTAVHAATRASGVAAVQRALGVPADGVIGPVTRAAIRRFQRRAGLPATGRLDAATRTAVVARGARTTRRSDRRRFTGAWVAALQERLGVDADGVFGPATRAAVRRFQTEQGLAPASGAPGPKTLAAMGLSRTSSPTGARTRSAPTTTAASGASTAAAVDAAREQIGAPYASGGTGPGGFDCSGLTVYAFKQAGISLPRTSYDQYRKGAAVPRDQIQAGDLVFFDSNGGGASHVGVATSPTTMISATTHGVREDDFSSGYWGEHYVGARRISA
jgi:cell wall-associated NlpC family hydrolase